MPFPLKCQVNFPFINKKQSMSDRKPFDMLCFLFSSYAVFCLYMITASVPSNNKMDAPSVIQGFLTKPAII